MSGEGHAPTTRMIYEEREGKVRHDAAPTSRAAARAVRVKSGSDRARVLRCLLVKGPQTDQQLQVALGMSGDTERPRRVELVEMGLVGDHHEGRTATGSPATAWYLTESGILWCREQGWWTP